LRLNGSNKKVCTVLLVYTSETVLDKSSMSTSSERGRWLSLMSMLSYRQAISDLA
jgi:hypothetical protein